jgi:predicted O-methyltransferase YrrM
MADPGSRSGESYGNQAIVELITELYAREDEAMARALAELERPEIPSIQVSPRDGAILALLLRMVSARRVVEIGTLTGYSALWLLRGMPADGHLWTLEADPAHAEAARRVFKAAGVSGRVTLLEGPARTALPGLAEEGPFGAVFIDADKEGYAAYGRWALDNLRSGGVVIADNAYVFGYLAGREPDGRAGREAIESVRRFHEMLAAECAAAMTLPTPDGLAVGIKA